MIRTALTATVLTLALAGCGAPEPQDQTPETPAAAPAAETAGGAMRAVAMLRTADGAAAGAATATAAADGQVTIALDVQNLSPGQHGVHVHMTGRCDPPGFQSAGGHWNPAERQHGLENPQGQHAGDMPNLTVAQDGRGTLEYQLMGASFDGLFDTDGSAFVVHASADDQRTDPSGESGDRIACGVFERG